MANLDSRRRKYYARHYCPTCGEARSSYVHWALGRIVAPHYKCTDRFKWVECPGGPVDNEKDHAP